MRILKLFPVCILISCFAHNAFCQDMIYKKDNTTINAKISEVGIEEIKYKDWNNPDGPDFIMSKNEISKIVFSNGREMIVTPDPYSLSGDVEVRNKTHAVKIDFFSPLTNHITIGYEWMYKVGFNIEGKFGIIGPGMTPNTENASGAFIKIGPKFLVGSDYVMPGMQYAHSMRGKYFKPELIVSIYTKDVSTYNYYYYSSASKEKVQYGSYGLNLVFGKQSIFGKTVTLDWFVGLGYAFHTMDFKNNHYNHYPQDKYALESSYDYSNLYFGHDFPLILSGGLTVGYLF